ncbi:c-type cytochrome [Flavobacterium facile]|uniref:c-type cytochrome n=1 Tax=Flavobacterium facile TaxID=2893174 RepID=UPI002E77E215|nr:cytochrome c [Flavobacterium sp. T-12]
MKTKFITGLFALVVAYGCTAKKSAVAPVPEVKEAMGISKNSESTVAVMVKPVNESPKITAEVLAEGKSLYGMNCAKCHELYNANSYTAEEWTPIVLRMQKKARISDEQREKIYAYLTTPQM